MSGSTGVYRLTVIAVYTNLNITGWRAIYSDNPFQGSLMIKLAVSIILMDDLHALIIPMPCEHVSE